MIDTNPAVAAANEVLRSFFDDHPEHERRYHTEPLFHDNVELLRHILAATVDAHTDAGILTELTNAILVQVVHHMIIGHDEPPVPPKPTEPPTISPVKTLADKQQP